MELIQTYNHLYLGLKDRYGRIKNEQILLSAKTGAGKTLATEGVAEEFKKLGYSVIVIADPKDELEFCYQMFKPKEYYHLEYLRKIGKIPEEKNVKIYHPFTFNIPETFLPEINFYTFSLKNLGRKEWGLIAETDFDKPTIRVLLQASQNITKEDGIYGIMHYIQRVVGGKTKEGKRIADPTNFYLKATTGTVKEISEISSYLQPFKKDFFLVKDSCPLNINWKEILTDQENYHVFISKWITDEKIKDFIVLSLLNGIISNKDYLKNPLLIIIPEIRKLCPFKPEGHKIYLSNAIKDSLSLIRSSGRGMSSLLDSQVFTDVDEDVRNTASAILLGELGAENDKVAKIYNYKREIREQLRKMDIPFSFMLVGKEDDAISIFPPSSMHKETTYNFFEVYREQKRDKMKRYVDLISDMRKDYDEEEEKIKDKVKRENKRKKELEEKKKAEKEQSSKEKTEVEEVKKKAEKKDQENKLKLMKLCYEIYNDSSLDKNDRSYRAIGKKLNLDKNTVKKYIKKYEVKDGGNQEQEEERID